MELGEVPAEGWQLYLQQEERRILAARYQCPRPPTPIDPTLDSDSYLDYLIATSPGDTLVTEVTQMQVDWDRFVTFGTSPEPPSPVRSPTPSPILMALNRPMGWPLTRHPSHDELGVTYSGHAPYHYPRSMRTRSRAREESRRRMRNNPLSRSCQGRSVLRLAQREWYVAPSGFAVTQYAPDDSVWRANDEANYLNWLHRGIRVHRSTVHQLLCVENIEALNAVLVEHDTPPITPLPTPPDWQTRWTGGDGSFRGVPTFLRAGYRRRTALASSIHRASPLVPMPTSRYVYDANTDWHDASSEAQAEFEDAGQAADTNR